MIMNQDYFTSFLDIKPRVVVFGDGSTPTVTKQGEIQV